MPAPPPVEERKSSVVWWFLGLLLVSLAILLIGAFFLAQYFLRSVQVSREGDQVAISTPAGDIHVDQSGPAETGLPIFPGAEVSERGAAVELTPPGEDPVSILAARYRTQAPLAEVDAWYRAQLGREFVREGPGRTDRKARIFGVDIRSDDTVFVAEGNEEMRVVGLRRQGLYTEIALVRVTRRETL
jgi:hypothetical protein